MEDTPRLHHTLVHVLSQHRKWLDARHYQTLAWMMAGLIQPGIISLIAWALHIVQPGAATGRPRLGLGSSQPRKQVVQFHLLNPKVMVQIGRQELGSFILIGDKPK